VIGFARPQRWSMNSRCRRRDGAALPARMTPGAGRGDTAAAAGPGAARAARGALDALTRPQDWRAVVDAGPQWSIPRAGLSPLSLVLCLETQPERSRSRFSARVFFAQTRPRFRQSLCLSCICTDMLSPEAHTTPQSGVADRSGADRRWYSACVYLTPPARPGRSRGGNHGAPPALALRTAGRRWYGPCSIRRLSSRYSARCAR